MNPSAWNPQQHAFSLTLKLAVAGCLLVACDPIAEHGHEGSSQAHTTLMGAPGEAKHSGQDLEPQALDRARFLKLRDMVRGNQVDSGLVRELLGDSSPTPIGVLGEIERLRERDANLKMIWEDDNPVPNYLSGNLRGPDSRAPDEVALAFLVENADLFEIQDPTVELKLNRERTVLHHNKTGWSHLVFEQTLAGVPVLYRGLRVHINAQGSVQVVHGDFQPGLQASAIDPNARLDTQALWQVIRRDLQFARELQVDQEPSLVVSLETGVPVLAWKTMVSAPGRANARLYLVDAHSGKVLYAEDQVYSFMTQHVGFGTDPHGYRLPLRTSAPYDKKADTYGDFVLEDDTRAGLIKGFDQTGYMATTSTPSFTYATPLLDSDNEWTSTSEVAGHHNAGLVMDYFDTVHGRDSWDDAGADLNMGYHARYGATRKGAKAMAAGNGSILCGDGDSTRLPYTTVDVIAHEFTHLVLGAEHFKKGGDEPNAINESLADTFAVFVEREVNNAFGDYNFLMGEGLYSSGSGLYTRDLEHPSADHYSEFDSGSSSHTNGGIVSYAMYLIWEGGTHPDSGVIVDGIGYENTRALYYEVIDNSYLSASPSFLELRMALSSAAEVLYGSGSDEQWAVERAFTAVGVTAEEIDLIQYAEHFDTWASASSSVTFGSPSSSPGVGYTSYTLEDGSMPSGSNEQLGMTPDYAGTQLIQGSFMLTLPEVDGSNEPHLRATLGYRNLMPRGGSSTEALIMVSFIPDGAGEEVFFESFDIQPDETLDSIHEDLTDWAGKTGTLHVIVSSSESDTVLWKNLEIVYQ